MSPSQYKIGTSISVKDCHGIFFNAVVGFVAFEKDNVDIAVLVLESTGPHFQHWTSVSFEPVKLLQEVNIVGLQTTMHDEIEVFAEKCSVRCIESRIGSTLFQSTYYAAQGFSGSGIVTIADDDK